MAFFRQQPPLQAPAQQYGGLGNFGPQQPPQPMYSSYPVAPPSGNGSPFATSAAPAVTGYSIPTQTTPQPQSQQQNGQQMQPAPVAQQPVQTQQQPGQKKDAFADLVDLMS